MSMSIAEIVQMMGGVQGINWDELAERPGNKSGIFDTEYITDYLVPAYGRVFNVFKTLDFQPESAEELRDRYLQMEANLKNPLELADQAFRAGAAALLPGQGFSLTTNELQSFVLYAWLTITHGVYSHRHALVHNVVIDDTIAAGRVDQAGKALISQADVMTVANDADWLCTMCNTIVKLDSLGVFRPIKKAGFSGSPYVAVGALPVAAIVVIAVVAIAAIAYVLIGIAETAVLAQKSRDREKLVEKVCSQAASSDPQNAQTICDTLAHPPPPPPDPVNSFVNKVMIVGGIGIVAYAFILFGPAIAAAMRSKSSAASAA